MSMCASITIYVCSIHSLLTIVSQTVKYEHERVYTRRDQSFLGRDLQCGLRYTTTHTTMQYDERLISYKLVAMLEMHSWLSSLDRIANRHKI